MPATNDPNPGADSPPDAGIGGSPLRDTLAQLAAKSPAPGGGAVAGMTGATAAALLGMVAAYSVGKRSLAEHETMLNAAIEELAEARAALLALGDEDAEAYGELRRLQKLAADDPERLAGERDAARRCLDVPRRTMLLALRLLEIAERFCGRTNAYLASDLAIGAVLGEAAVTSAAWNVRVNLDSGSEPAERAEVQDELNDAEAIAGETRQRIDSACRG